MSEQLPPPPLKKATSVISRSIRTDGESVRDWGVRCDKKTDKTDVLNSRHFRVFMIMCAICQYLNTGSTAVRSWAVNQTHVGWGGSSTNKDLRR